MLRHHAPAAAAFVDEHLQTVLVRRSPASGSASSSSNRDHVGTCVLTNLDASADPVLVCVEALTHEAIHQWLYRVERSCGPLCDLDATRRYRSPWSGNRIPLHSLIHASFVYFGLLVVWYRCIGRLDAERPAAFVRDRIARSLFGYAFLPALLEQPSFPRDSVEPAVLDLIRRVAACTADTGIANDPRRSIAAQLRSPLVDGWSERVGAALERIVDDRPGTSHVADTPGRRAATPVLSEAR